MALSSHALTTLDAVKSELGLPTGVVHADDTYLERKINSASDDIERFCCRHFERAAIAAEPVQANGQLVLVLERYPLLTLTSVSYAGAALDASSYEIWDAESAMVRLISGAYDASSIAANIAGDPVPGTARKLYSVAYTGGYVLPKDESVGPPPVVRTLPEGLEDACILEVVSRYRQRGRDRAVTSEKILSWGATYANATPGPSGLTPEVEARVTRFKRWLL